MERETHPSPANTQEFMALWNTVKEEHFVSQLLPLLPHLFSGSVRLDPEGTEWAARHLVRALHLAAIPEAGVHVAIAYLTEIVEGRTEASPTAP
jgi:hypothetical protein